jgi:hypothetical protein
VLEQYRERFAADLLGRPPQQFPGIGAVAADMGRLDRASPSSGDAATLRSALQDLKTQVDEHSAVVAAAVKLAEDAAGVQQALVASTALLEAAVAALPSSGS